MQVSKTNKYSVFYDKTRKEQRLKALNLLEVNLKQLLRTLKVLVYKLKIKLKNDVALVHMVLEPYLNPKNRVFFKYWTQQPPHTQKSFNLPTYKVLKNNKVKLNLFFPCYCAKDVEIWQTSNFTILKEYFREVKTNE